jgi:hypothetical protein
MGAQAERSEVFRVPKFLTARQGHAEIPFGLTCYE